MTGAVGSMHRGESRQRDRDRWRRRPGAPGRELLRRAVFGPSRRSMSFEPRRSCWPISYGYAVKRRARVAARRVPPCVLALAAAAGAASQAASR